MDEITRKIDWLKWVMDFCNSDPEKMKGLEKWHHSIRAYIFAYWTLQDYEKSENEETSKLINQEWENERAKNEELLRGMYGIFRNLLEIFLFWTKNPQTDILLGLSLEKAYRPVFYFYPDGIKRQWIEKDDLISNLHVATRITKGATWMVTDETIEEAINKQDFLTSEERAELKNLKNILDAGKYYNVAFTFLRLLSDVPPGWIKKCEGCRHFFLNPTEREKVYCNSSCASRSIARMKRKELRKHPRKYKAYLKKQLGYSMKRYRELKKAQLGPNVKVGKKRAKQRKEG